MKIGSTRNLTALLSLAILTGVVRAEDKPALKDEKEKVSYGIGMNIGNNLKRQSYDVDVDLIAKAMKDVLGGKETLLTEQQAQEVLKAYVNELRAKQEEKNKQLAETNKKKGEAWLAENRKKDGVQVKEVILPDGTNKAELQFKVVAEGTGEPPKNGDTVTVNYKGTLIDGTEFDSSYKKGQPASFNINGVIKGWTEALLMMKPGAKYELYIPSSLAYADRGRPGIEPGATLVFEVELLSTKSPAPPAPTTSDIIKVPSAEELKAGAKIEVIKPEDVNKLKAGEAKPK
jgi:FKBP-type peptidyl-prolyl cis-trans isomerase FklB